MVHMRMGVRIIIKPAKFFMAFLLSLNFAPILTQKIPFVKCFFLLFLFSTIFYQFAQKFASHSLILWDIHHIRSVILRDIHHIRSIIQFLKDKFRKI